MLQKHDKVLDAAFQLSIMRLLTSGVAGNSLYTDSEKSFKEGVDKGF